MADKKDSVSMDIPLLIRVLELVREDIKTDMDLHRVVERLIEIRDKGILTMDDYNYIADFKKKVTEGTLEELKKQPDVAETKKPVKPNNLNAVKCGMNNPFDPWTSKSTMEEVQQIQETTKSLNAYISSLGFNPKFMTRNQKQKFAQSEKYAAWVRMRNKTDPSQQVHQTQQETVMGKLANSYEEDGDPIVETGGYSVDDPKGTMTRVYDEVGSQRAKSARIIKSIYKRQRMKEDLGSQNDPSPKGDEPKQKEEKPGAKIVVSGGKTQTGEKRDDIEIDPEMKAAPTQNGNIKTYNTK